MKSKAHNIKRIGLVANADKAAAALSVRKAAGIIQAAGKEVMADVTTARTARLDVSALGDAGALAGRCDLLLVFGGDGTMLQVAREVAGSKTPMLGINLGSLGFLTAVPSNQLKQALTKVLQGDFEVERRPLIEAASGAMQGKEAQSALNDFVISRGAGSRMIELEVRVDDELLTRYRCDGLIVSSPTGSTAYSLSAGGAIVSPSSSVFTITPICPHTLSNRSVVISMDSLITVKAIAPRPETLLAADGQVETVLQPGDTVQIRRSRRELYLVRLQGQSFFRTLRQKLSWSGSNV